MPSSWVIDMRSQWPTVLLLLVLLFIGFGDRVLPSPLKEYSYGIRSGINRILIGSFPDWNPTPAKERTEEAVEDLQRR